MHPGACLQEPPGFSGHRLQNGGEGRPGRPWRGAGGRSPRDNQAFRLSPPTSGPPHFLSDVHSPPTPGHPLLSQLPQSPPPAGSPAPTSAPLSPLAKTPSKSLSLGDTPFLTWVLNFEIPVRSQELPGPTRAAPCGFPRPPLLTTRGACTDSSLLLEAPAPRALFPALPSFASLLSPGPPPSVGPCSLLCAEGGAPPTPSCVMLASGQPPFCASSPLPP